MISKFCGLICLFLFSPILLLISILIILIDGGPVIFKQKRIGKGNTSFILYKFRSMKNNVGDIPTHLVKNSSKLISRCGHFIRKYSLDELPQIINIIQGDLCFVGPRPALYNQKDLIELRTKYLVHNTMPGVTGWAQINGRDDLSIKEKVNYDVYYCENAAFIIDLKIIILTIIQFFTKKGISH